MCDSSPAVGSRASRPMAIRRRVAWPTCITVFTEVAGKPSKYWAKVRGSYSSHGAPALR